MLAIDGGRPVRSEGFPKRGLFGEEEHRVVGDMFEHAMRTGDAIGYGGVEEQAYEGEFAAFLGGGYADLVNSGTAALYVAVGALELEPAGEVVVPPITDPGGVMPVALLNQVPVVADAVFGSFNTGAAQIEAVMTPHTRAIVVAHIAGEPADLAPIVELASSRGVPLIEDCAQAHGARYRGQMAGTFGKLAVFSTMSGKHHATGPQGGVVFTRDEEMYWRCRRFSDRGKPFNTDVKSNVRAGLNLNGNDLAAAIGRVQLRRLPETISRRRVIADGIRTAIASCVAVRTGTELADTEGVYWFMRFCVDAERLSVDKEQFARAVAAEGIPITASYRHIPAEAVWFRERRVFPPSDYPWGLPAYGGDRQAVFPCPVAVAATESHFILSIHENLGEGEIRDIAAAIHKVEEAYLK